MIKEYEQDVVVCTDVLKLDGVILYPTDTIWGIGCDATSESAIHKIFAIKHREPQKSVVLLMTDVKQLSNYIASSIPDLETWLTQFTEPTTVVYPNAINLPKQVLAEDGSVAVRITKDPFCRSLIKRFRKPIVSTSANISGEPSPIHFHLISPNILREVDYVVHHRQHDIATRPESRIVKMMPDGTYTVLR